MTQAEVIWQIIVLAEFGTTGPETTPPCKALALSAEQATSLRGRISTLARLALQMEPAT